MTKNYVIALIAIVIVAAAAIGAYFLLSDNDKGDKTDITGTYVLYEADGKEMGQKALMTEGENPVYMAIENKKITIDSFDGKNLKFTWGEDKMIGTYSNGEIWFGDYFKENGITYLEYGHGYVKDGVFYLSSVAVDEGGTHTFACTAVFVKEGKKTTPSVVTSPVKVGDVFNQLSKVRSIDGVYEDVSESNNDIITVKSLNKGICVLEIKYKDSGIVKTRNCLTVMTGDGILISVHGADRTFDKHYVNGDLMVSNISYDLDGKKVAYTIASSKGTDVPKYELPDLKGKVYSGKTYASYSSGTTTEQNMSFIFADGEQCFAYATTAIAGVSLTKTVQLIPTNNGTLVSFSSEYEFGGKKYINFYDGTISKDLKTMELHWVTYCEDGSYFSSINVLRLANGDNELIGSYVGASYEYAYGDVINKSVFDNSYGYYFTITSVNGNIATGTFMGREYVGEINSGMISFAYRNSAYGISLLCDATIDKGKGCLMRTVGSSLNDGCGMASVVSMTLSGKDSAPEIPTKEELFEAGASFITFGAVKKVNGEDVTVTELGQTLKCVNSFNGLYSFEFTDNGKSYSLCGRWASSNSMIRLGGYGDGHNVTFNLNHHGDFICLDRESEAEDGTGTVISYRMSDDGKERETFDVASINGKSYTGELEIGTIVNGVLKTEKVKITIKVVSQSQSLVTLNGKKVLGAHLLSLGENKLKMNVFFYYEIGGVKYNFEVYGDLSDNNNTLVLDGLGKSRTSDTAFCSFVGTLKA